MTKRKPRAPRTYPYGGSARVVGWFSIWPDDVLECRCGWSGHLDQLDSGWYDEVIDGSCPTCDTMLVIRPRGATLAQARRALRTGHPDAQELIDQFERLPELD